MCRILLNSGFCAATTGMRLAIPAAVGTGSAWRRDQGMCGIVGILGTKAVAGDLVDALRRLEYRGYDSAGIATVEDGHLDRRRAEGKLKNPELRLSNHPLQGHTGLGHTPWATHRK